MTTVLTDGPGLLEEHAFEDLRAMVRATPELRREVSLDFGGGNIIMRFGSAGMAALRAAAARLGDPDLLEEFSEAEPCFELDLPIEFARLLASALDERSNVVSIGRSRAYTPRGGLRGQR